MPVVEPSLATRLADFTEVGGIVVWCAVDEPARSIVGRVRQVIHPSSEPSSGRRGSRRHPVREVWAETGPSWFCLNVSAESRTVTLDAGVRLREVPWTVPPG